MVFGIFEIVISRVSYDVSTLFRFYLFSRLIGLCAFIKVYILFALVRDIGTNLLCIGLISVQEFIASLELQKRNLV